jgi:plasmid stabilization system protein ParE
MTVFLHPQEISIYALFDPLTGVVRYVGATIDPKKRLTQHLFTKRSRIAGWIRELKQRGDLPGIRILEKVAFEDAPDAEQRWIREMRESGQSLLNAHKGSTRYQVASEYPRVSRQKIREIAAKAKADDRTVKRVLRGAGGRNSAWERVVEAMAALGVEQPPAPAAEGALVSIVRDVHPQVEKKPARVHIIGPDGEELRGVGA